MFRYGFEWNTQGRPKGHNGTHSVKLVERPRFRTYQDGPGWGQEYDGEVDEPTATVLNLVAEKVTTNQGTVDYFFLDPDLAEPVLPEPTITFAARDAKAGLRYRWFVDVRESAESVGNDTATITGWTTTGGQVTVRLNDQVWMANAAEPETASNAWPRQYGALKTWGTYTYNIRIVAVDAAGSARDEYIWRSPRLRFSTHQAHRSQSYVTVDYTLGGGRDADKVAVHCVSFEGRLLGSRDDLPCTAGAGVEGQVISLKTDDNLDRILFCGQDSEAAAYREHTSRRLPVVNNRAGAGARAFLAIEYQRESHNWPAWFAGVYGEPEHVMGWLRYISKLSGYDDMRPLAALYRKAPATVEEVVPTVSSYQYVITWSHGYYHGAGPCREGYLSDDMLFNWADRPEPMLIRYWHVNACQAGSYFVPALVATYRLRHATGFTATMSPLGLGAYYPDVTPVAVFRRRLTAAAFHLQAHLAAKGMNWADSTETTRAAFVRWAKKDRAPTDPTSVKEATAWLERYWGGLVGWERVPGSLRAHLPQRFQSISNAYGWDSLRYVGWEDGRWYLWQERP